MDLKGKRIAILAEDLYEELELWYPALRFREAGAEVEIVAPAEQTYTSKHGYPVKADRRAADARAADYDAFIVPGGYAPDRMRRHQAMVDLLREGWKQGKVVAAICHGGWMLASAGILRGRKVTGFFAIRDDLVNAGAEFEDRPVVRDGRLVTSRRPDDLPFFCSVIIEILATSKGRSARAA